MCLPPTERVGQPKVRASGAPIPPTGALIDARSIGTVLREEEGLTVAEREVFWGKGPRAKARRVLDMAEVAKHDTREDLWVCIEGRAYDLTRYAKHHPGGWQCLASLAGRDATDAFVNFHPASVYRAQLPALYVGDVRDPETTAFARDARALRNSFLQRGMFETSPAYYYRLVAWLASLLITALWLTVATPHKLCGAVVLGCFWQQSAFAGHDIGHNAITHKRSWDYWLGVVLGNTTGGISLGWWKHTHNAHHVAPNSVEHDPDNQHLPVFAVNELMADGFFSEFHGAEFPFTRAAAALVRWQHRTYYLVMAFARFNLYAQSWAHVLSADCARGWRRFEVGTLAGFWLWLAALAWCFESWGGYVAWLLLAHAASGLLEVQITLSHFAEEVYHGKPHNDDSDEWYRNQLRTTLDIECPAWLDWLHGGLQFQAAHHLWPRLPRHALRQATDELRELCAEHGVPYKAMGFVAANRRVCAALRSVAVAERTPKRA